MTGKQDGSYTQWELSLLGQDIIYSPVARVVYVCMDNECLQRSLEECQNRQKNVANFALWRLRGMQPR